MYILKYLQYFQMVLNLQVEKDLEIRHRPGLWAAILELYYDSGAEESKGRQIIQTEQSPLFTKQETGSSDFKACA